MTVILSEAGPTGPAQSKDPQFVLHKVRAPQPVHTPMTPLQDQLDEITSNTRHLVQPERFPEVDCDQTRMQPPLRGKAQTHVDGQREYRHQLGQTKATHT